MAEIKASIRILGIFLLIVSAALFVTIFYLNSRLPNETLVFSTQDMLNALWEDYKRTYVETGTGRTLDRQRGDITTSEGQSYSMLRAVWLDDRETFDIVWDWTKRNLQRPNDNLFSWLYGERPNGTLGVLTHLNGQNTASDANTDIALALIFAYSRWEDVDYLDEAKLIIEDIWDQEVILINNKPYLAASNIEKLFPDPVLINPSYLAPYAYRIFSIVNPEKDWQGLIDSSYELINNSIESSLDKNSSVGLPPDWVVVDRQTENLAPPESGDITTDYGFDAMRVPWRMALDWYWYEEPRARSVLLRMDFLPHVWRVQKILGSSYSHDGQIVLADETPAFYGGNLGALMISNPSFAEEVYNLKLKILFNPDTSSWRVPLGYYDDNWAWFGIALYNKSLFNLSQNLSEKLPKSASLNN